MTLSRAKNAKEELLFMIKETLFSDPQLQDASLNKNMIH